MNISDLLNQGIQIQGKIIIQEWKEDKYNILFSTDDFENDYDKLGYDIEDQEITYMYCQNETMTIEVKAKE